MLERLISETNAIKVTPFKTELAEIRSGIKQVAITEEAAIKMAVTSFEMDIQSLRK